MNFNTDFQLGNIFSVLNNPNYSDSMKMFAAISTCDNYGIINYSNALRNNKLINEKCLTKILIFTAAINLVSKRRNESVEILNNLGTPAFEKVEGWQQSFFYSTWQLLSLQLRIRPNFYEYSIGIKNDDKKIIIGDSHIFGIIPGLLSNLNYNFNYIPGFRYSLISSPQDNLKKVAFRNALASSYEYDQVILSIGEIDTRSFLIDFFTNKKYSIKNSIIYFKNIFLESLNYFQKYISKNQEMIIIIPPPPFKIIKNFEDKEKLNDILIQYNNIIEELKNILFVNNVKFLEYPSGITSSDGYVDDKNLVDHAHFHQDIYMELLGFKKTSMESHSGVSNGNN
jgi:hypothetical protein